MQKWNRFFRWETVSRPRVIQRSTESTIVRDTLDEEADLTKGESKNLSPTAAKDWETAEELSKTGGGSERRAMNGSETYDFVAANVDVRHRRPWEALSESTITNDDDTAGDNDNSTEGERPLERSWDRVPTGLACSDSQQAVVGEPPGGTQSVGLEVPAVNGTAAVMATTVPARPTSVSPPTLLETPSFVAAKAAATAAACLGSVPGTGAGDVESLMSPSTMLRMRIEQQRHEAVESCIGEGVGVTLRNPPPLDEEEGDGGGLGLGLRLGVEAMSSPPPRMETARRSPGLWSPRYVSLAGLCTVCRIGLRCSGWNTSFPRPRGFIFLLLTGLFFFAGGGGSPFF